MKNPSLQSQALAVAIRRTREATGDSQTAFGKRFGVSRGGVAKWEGCEREPVAGHLMVIRKLAQQHKLATEERVIHAAIIAQVPEELQQVVWAIRTAIEDAIITNCHLPLEYLEKNHPAVLEEVIKTGDKLVEAAALTGVLDPGLDRKWLLWREERERNNGEVRA